VKLLQQSLAARLCQLFTELSPAFPSRLKPKCQLAAFSEANLASLRAKALLSSTKSASNSEAKVPCAKIASPSEAKSHGEAILALPMTKKKAFKAKLKASQPKKVNH